MLTLTDNAGTQSVQLTGTVVVPDWQSLGGIVIARLTAVSTDFDHMSIFGVGSDQNIYENDFNGVSWTGWGRLSIGGQTNAGVTAVNRNGGVDLFVRGLDNALWYARLGSGPSGWQSLGGRLIGGPGAASAGATSLVVFARGTDNGIYYRSLGSPSFSSWQSLSGLISADPAATSSNSGEIDLLVRGLNGHMYEKVSRNGLWTSAWSEPLPGTVIGSGVGLTSSRPGRIDVVERGLDGAVYRAWFDGTWHSFAASPGLGGLTNADPGATSRVAGLIDVLVRGTDGSVYWKVITS
jgi:hypothetical protein